MGGKYLYMQTLGFEPRTYCINIEKLCKHASIIMLIYKWYL